MKRRILAILLAAIMVLSVVPFSAFAEDAVTCPGEAGFHGEEHVKAGLADKYATIAPTCNKDGYDLYTCKKCGNQFPVNFVPAAGTPHDPVKHDEVPKSCTEDGVKEYYICTKCTERCFDEDMTIAVPNDAALVIPAAHTWDNVNGVDVPADCVNGSKKVRTCTVAGCGVSETVGTPADDATGHKWVLDSFTAPPTCKDEGEATYKCDNGCGETKTVVVKPSKYMHEFTHVARVEATCEADGNVEYYECTICGVMFETDDPDVDDVIAEGDEVLAGGHYIGALLETSAPNCVTAGKIKYICGRCGETIEEPIDPNPKYYYYMVKDGVKYTVTVGGKTIELFVKPGDEWYAGDETALVSGYTWVKSDVIYHKFNPFADAETEATHNSYGYVQRMCFLCGTEVNELISPPLPHDDWNGSLDPSVAVSYSAPTCDTYGYVRYKCSCKTVVYKALAPLQHKLPNGNSALVSVNTSDCANAGISYSYCTNANCNAEGFELKSSVTVGDITVNFGGDRWVKVDSVTAADVRPNNHTWSSDIIVNAATCVKDGSEVKYCSVCREHITTTLYATGHKFVLTWDNLQEGETKTAIYSDQWKGFTAIQPDDDQEGKILATCGQAGYIKLECAYDDCDVYSTEDSFAWDNGAVSTTISLKVADAKIHNPQPKSTPATCLTPGKTWDHCDNCGLDENVNNNVPFVDLPEYETLDAAKAAHPQLDESTKDSHLVGTCLLKGLDQYTCGCGRQVLVVEPETGHHIAPENTADWETLYSAATCFDAEVFASYICTKCTELVVVYPEGKTTPDAALGHNKTLVYEPLAPTCTEKGHNAVYKCSNAGCGYLWMVALDHYVDTDGEPTDFGMWKSDYDPEVHTLEWMMTKTGFWLAALGHDTDNADQIPGKSATCMDGGYTPYKVCDRCGEKVGYVETAKKDHIYATFFNVETVGGVSTQVFDKNTTPTCVLPAYDHVYCVFGCGSEFIQVHTYKEELGHDWDDGVEQEQTCQQLGGILHTCKNGCTETWLENPTDGYAVHQNAAGKLLEGKCTKGYADKICEWCSAEFDAHLVKVTDIHATCEERGYRVETCTDRENCPNTEAILEVKYTAEALGHKYEGGEEVVVTPATESSEGLKHVRCVRYAQCGEYKEVVIPADTTIHYDLVYRNNNGANGFATGHTLAVDIYMFSEKATVLSHEFVLNYNTTDLTLVENGIDLNTDDFFYAAANDNAGKIKFIATAATPVEFVENEKYLVATVYFTINDIVPVDVATAEIELSISGADAYTKDKDGNTIDIEEEINAEDKIVVSKRYDANGDGKITAEDAIAIYDLAKKGGADNYYFAAADIDGNGAVKVTDLIAFQEYFVTLA